MARNLIDASYVYMLARKSKYLAAAIALVFAWQAAVLFANSVQLLLSKPASRQVLFVTPEYTENLAGAGAWEWSDYKNLYSQIETNTAPAITLVINLLGIMNFGEVGFAMMKVENGKETLYKKGDYVRGNIKLDKIGLKSVTLTDGGAVKVYNLINKESNIFLAPVVTKASNLITGPTAPVATRKRVSLASLPKARREKLVEFENKVKENPLAVAGDVDATPISKNGEVYGYRFNYKIDPSLLLSIGLLPTDVIISVNNIPAATIAADTAIASRLWGEKRFSIVYERNGAKNTLNLNR